MVIRKSVTVLRHYLKFSISMSTCCFCRPSSISGVHSANCMTLMTFGKTLMLDLKYFFFLSANSRLLSSEFLMRLRRTRFASRSVQKFFYSGVNVVSHVLSPCGRCGRTCSTLMRLNGAKGCERSIR